ncbi:hypothetical protein BCU94_00775 [Shewanella sp. 10N.286.52.C2]|uniref:hypothetical protein n=1 Tax=unclassified Shewanella TaxID=196818 RepID=UPI000C856E33|nr:MULTISPECIES: hypothetical protein [unclassified Shewanella]MDO6638546.1 hypothetical protein [Shewanella sp. 5_MG-2023]PMG32289.1 hypothetical protein BCU94_00775 [Shewanella sp. 10N.286.52.C2]
MKLSNQILPLSFLLMASLIVGGCNGISIRTNADEYITYQAKASTVEIYQPSELYNHDNEPLGEVVTTYCANKPEVIEVGVPSISMLKKELKVQTQQRGGNALIITDCGKMIYPACSIYLECNGLAYLLKS